MPTNDAFDNMVSIPHKSNKNGKVSNHCRRRRHWTICNYHLNAVLLYSKKCSGCMLFTIFISISSSHIHIHSTHTRTQSETNFDLISIFWCNKFSSFISVALFGFVLFVQFIICFGACCWFSFFPWISKFIIIQSIYLSFYDDDDDDMWTVVVTSLAS